MPILTVGEKFPEFNLTALTGGETDPGNPGDPAPGESLVNGGFEDGATGG